MRFAAIVDGVTVDAGCDDLAHAYQVARAAAKPGQSYGAEQWERQPNPWGGLGTYRIVQSVMMPA